MLLFPEKDSKISSLVEYLILLTLKKEGKLRGVDIIHKISEQFENWTPQSGTIYPVLSRLFEKKGLITLEGKYYRINQLGEKVLEDHLKTYINTIIFIDNIFNYSRSLMNEFDIMQSEHKWIHNHMPYVRDLIDTLSMVRPNLPEEKKSEVYVNLRNLRDSLHFTLDLIDKQINAIKDEEKIVKVKIQ